MSERQEASYFNLLELFRSYCGAPLSTLPSVSRGGRKRSAGRLKLTLGRATARGAALSTLAGNADEHRRRVDAMLQVAWSKVCALSSSLFLCRAFRRACLAFPLVHRTRARRALWRTA